MFLAIRVQEPLLQFYGGTHISPRRIITLKPFSYRELLNEDVHVKLLADGETRNLGIKLIKHLIKGYSALSESMPSFNEVFGTKLIFSENSDTAITSSDNLLIDLEEALDILKSEARRGVVVIALSEIPERIYRQVKIKALTYSKLNLRTQFIEKSTIESYSIGGRGYVYLLMNLATAIYAKIGGVPWKLSRSILPIRGLILGISFSRRRVKVSESEVIYYGAVGVLDRYGEHLYTEIKMFTASPRELKTKGLFVPYDKLKSILEDAIKQYGWIPQIMIHKSAPLVNEEIKAVKEITEKYSKDKPPVFYISTHVKSNTIYRAYDSSVSDYSIQRGLMLLRSEKSSKWIQYILFTTGRVYRSASERGKLGTPKPLELAIDTNMPELSPIHIGEQFLALTKLDWNTTDPEVREPITIKYSRKAAQIAPEILSPEVPDLRVADIRDLM
uniref:Piwi domain-containing protein n=1 Tax=Ignisphaera aggregans TaxID=334771 RepID=A0A7J2TC95_9CREN